MCIRDRGTDIKGIKFALQQIVSRHEILRSTLEIGDNQEHIQIVHDKPLPIEEILLGEEDNLDTLLNQAINQTFKLDAEYPIRVKIYSVKLRKVLLINIHHIASDGWSTEIFQRELFAYYEAYTNNNLEFSLSPLEIQYKDFAVWQRAYLKGQIFDQQLAYWKNKLTGYQTLELPTDYPRPKVIDYHGNFTGFTFDKEVSEKLKALAIQLGVTLHSILLGLTNILLSKYSGQKDIIIGSPTANSCLLYTSPSPRDATLSRMPSSA